MNFDPPAPPNGAAVPSHTDGLDRKVSTRQKQGATRHKGVGAKGDNSAFPAPAGPSNPGCLIRKAPPRVHQPAGTGGWPRSRTGAVRVVR